MHPRNIFRKPPDYTELAIKYPKFRLCCELQLNGKCSINYKNIDSLIVLTQTLLMEYFQLRVLFAPGSLIPALPLRLNYILWIEDLIKEDPSEYIVRGIDIGCGSSCIYSLLGAKKNNWRMMAIELNDINLEYAHTNIENNKLNKLITLYKQHKNAEIFADYFRSSGEYDCDSTMYDFCMCNPPFFDSNSDQQMKRRENGKRPPPHNCPTGHKDELCCDGGEVKFVEQIIDESLLFKHHIRIFTTMLGIKCSLPKVLNILKSKNIENFCTTEFHQGKTTRWGVAWTFDPLWDLKSFQ